MVCSCRAVQYSAYHRSLCIAHLRHTTVHMPWSDIPVLVESGAHHRELQSALSASDVAADTCIHGVAASPSGAQAAAHAVTSSRDDTGGRLSASSMASRASCGQQDCSSACQNHSQNYHMQGSWNSETNSKVEKPTAAQSSETCSVHVLCVRGKIRVATRDLQEPPAEEHIR